MELLPSARTRYLLLFTSLLALVALIEGLARSVANFGGLGFTVTLWACFGVAYGWIILEPLIRSTWLLKRAGSQYLQNKVAEIGAGLATESGLQIPTFLVFESEKFDVMVAGLGKGSYVLISVPAAEIDERILRSILAHEYGHLKLKHSTYRLCIYGSMLAIATLGASSPFVTVAANFFVLWAMRSMEFAADRFAVAIVGGKAFKDALWYVGSQIGDIPRWQTIFSTHPTFIVRMGHLN